MESAKDMQRGLQNWLNQYVSVSPDAAPDAQRPLVAAEVRIDQPDGTGPCTATVIFTPSYQLEPAVPLYLSLHLEHLVHR